MLPGHEDQNSSTFCKIGTLNFHLLASVALAHNQHRHNITGNSVNRLNDLLPNTLIRRLLNSEHTLGHLRVGIGHIHSKVDLALVLLELVLEIESVVQPVLLAPFVEVTRIALNVDAAFMPPHTFLLVFALREDSDSPAQLVEKGGLGQVEDVEVGPTLAAAGDPEEEP